MIGKVAFFLVILLACPGLADEGTVIFYPNAKERVTAAQIDKTLEYKDEYTALRVIAKLCIPHRVSARGLERSLKANGYFKGYYTQENDGRSVSWFNDGALPTLSITVNRRVIQSCSVAVAKPAKRIARLEDLLDKETKEDIQRLPASTFQPNKGERGWVLRPGFEHSLIVVQGRSGLSSIALRYLGD
ncbi:MAG: hypothetical protein ABJM43_19535 [Paracoccaceae bacterium]|uniref:hypothetical protein n=1 Tax=Ascidiaceihabitans sp. TaxID=1872644 RepID=UPI0032979C3B